MDTEPPPETKIEYSVAQLTELFANVHRGKTTPVFKLSDFILFKDVWSSPDSEESLGELVQSFGKVKRNGKDSR